MSKPDLILYPETNGWKQYRCSSPGCEWKRDFMGEGVTAEREGLAHVETHSVEMKVSEFMTVRGGRGNDAFAAHANLVNVARAMFANEGIDLKTVETFRCSVKRNHDFDEVQGGTVLPMWDTFAEVIYPAPVDEA
jgi:hypothetical protein